MQEILINNAVHETRVAVLEDGVLEELRIERNADVSLIGNIYLGVVGKVLPGMQSAFVEIGLPRAAFLHVSDMRQAHQENGGTLPIERLLHDGQVVLVQVAKDPIGTKGARLTTEISLAGRLLVYLPYTSHIGVSQKIEDEAERERLKEAVAKLTEEQGIPKGGFIVRTSGEDAKPEDFVNDMKYLEKLWLDIEAKTHIAGAPCLLYSDVSISQRVLRDIVTEQTGKIIVDNPEVFEELQRFGKKFVPEAVELLELYNSDRPLFDQYNLEKEIEASLSRRVDLKSGGYLIIDQTEAMTTIDINTGAFVGHRNLDETIFNTNIEATKAIAQQLQLRNLGGIIIIDFIDMQTDEHRNRVIESLEEALSKDRVKTNVNGFTQLGLVEMTRKRTRESLEHVLCDECPTCQGRGRVKTVETVCYEIMREIIRVNHLFSSEQFVVYASPAVADYLIKEESHGLLPEIEMFISKQVQVKTEQYYNQEQFDVVVM